MESSGEAVDDPGSGWLQVKKKHRSSSKFSLQGWVGGLSGKQASNVVHSQPPLNVNSGNQHNICGGQPSKASEDLIAHGLSSYATSTSVSNEDDMGMQYLDKCLVNQDNKSPNSQLFIAADVYRPDCKTGDDQEPPQKDNPDALPKIRWPDLAGAPLILHQGNTVGADIRFRSIGKDNSVCRKPENADSSVSCISSCIDPKENKLVVTSLDAEHNFQEIHLLSLKNDSVEENCKEVNEVSIEDVEVVQITNEKVVNARSDVSSFKETHSEIIEAVNNDPLVSSSPSGESILCAASGEAGMMLELLAPPVICEAEISEVPVDGGLGAVLISHDSEKTGPESPVESIGTTSAEYCGGQQADTILDDLSRAQIKGAIGGDNTGESKERFRQRLWCFLFENLNRAVDELYLLCELECDVEQLKEAILVLEEAASDFKDLNSRVEEFEKVKRSSSQLIDGTPIAIKSDHRRPHALSWEVRRMTTSPRRAEILSSSLEAFRKIQQERTCARADNDAESTGFHGSSCHYRISETSEQHTWKSDEILNAEVSVSKQKKQSRVPDLSQGNFREKRNVDLGRCSKINLVKNGRLLQQIQSDSDTHASSLQFKEGSAPCVTGKSRRELVVSISETDSLLPKDKMLTENMVDKNPKSVDHLKKHIPLSDRDKEKKKGTSRKSMDAWKEKRNWEDILASPFHVSSRYSHSPGMSRKSVERARILHDKLMSPEKKKKTALDMKKEAEEKHARAMRIRSELENERVQKLQRTSEKLNRVNEWQAVRSMKLRQVMYARHQRSESRHEAFLAQVVRRAGDESSKVNEVRFITSLNEGNKKLILRQKLHDSELRRAERIQVIRTKQKEDLAREEAVLERKKLIEAEKLQRLADTQRKKEEAQVRREEERKASSAAREAKAMEQMRRKEVRAKAQQEEAELLAQKLAERLSESEQRRKFYLEQIRERASMDFRDQSSPLLRRSLTKDGQGRSTPTNNGEHYQANNASGSGGSMLPSGNTALQHSLKRRVKRIRQRLMTLKYEFPEPPVSSENAGIGYRTAVGTARAKIGRWLQELQRLRQARKKGAANIGLITNEMIKFLEGKEPELQACRQAGLLDFISSALPASHTSKPEACQVTIYLLRLLRVVLSVPSNRSYFLAQNLLPPIIPMLAAALENYTKIAASSNILGFTNLLSSKTSIENLESISEVLDGFLWTVATIIGHVSYDERQCQMQDGLLELVVAYQVIHRLRELFALHDRPQVECSPFPSSILLSINLLAVLTSRFRTMSLIDWESFPIETVPRNKIVEAKCGEALDFGCSFLCNSSGDNILSSYAVNDTVAVSLPDVPEDRPLDESCKIRRNDDLESSNKKSDKAESINTKIGNADILDEAQSILIDDIAKCSVSGETSVDNVTEQKNENKSCLKQPVACLLSAMSETGLVCLPSLLTAVLLQTNNRLPSEQASYVLPSNFEEVATGVLKVLNNLALMDIIFIQRMLARPDLKMELFHLMSFLLSHCTSKWVVATDQIGLLLLESLSLLAYFALFHPENQSVLRWGKSPTILHKVCDLPFAFFSDPELMPVLASTLVAACFGCQQNKSVVQQELSTDMILSLLKSCRNGSNVENPSTDESSESNQLGSESRKFQGDVPQRSNRLNPRSIRVPLGKSGVSGNCTKTLKTRSQKDSKAMKLCEEWGLKKSFTASESSYTLMLHSRFPGSFIDKAEQFFSVEVTGLGERV